MTESKTKVKIPRAPAGLQARGRSLWRDVFAEFELNVDERELLVELCRQTDLCEALLAELAGADLMVEGRFGPTVNPLVDKLRAARGELRHLTASLALPHPEGGSVRSGNQSRASRAAEARWRAG